MTKDELLQNIEEQKSKNTGRSTLNTWKSWCQNTGETRKVEEIKNSSLAAFGRFNVDLDVTCSETKSSRHQTRRSKQN